MVDKKSQLLWLININRIGAVWSQNHNYDSQICSFRTIS